MCFKKDVAFRNARFWNFVGSGGGGGFFAICCSK